MADIKIDQELIQNLVEQAVEKNILSTVETLALDPAWLDKIERLINEAVVRHTLLKIGLMDINTVIHERVDQHLAANKQEMFKGISDQATQTQLTVMDETTVFENKLTTRALDVVDTAHIGNLIVTGLINTDNRSWQELATAISKQTLDQLSNSWREQLVKEVGEQIKSTGIDFSEVTIDGVPLVKDNRLSDSITGSNLQSLGILSELRVGGQATINETFNVVNRRVGVNTQEPEMALSIWDEEVSINLGKFKDKQAYIGTSRAQGLVLGVNRGNQLEINEDGLTIIKKLQIGQHRNSHSAEVPGWSGTKGDIVFNINMGADRVFAWMCLGNYKWQVLKSAE